jgi:hypothetical protein
VHEFRDIAKPDFPRSEGRSTEYPVGDRTPDTGLKSDLSSSGLSERRSW